MCVGAITVHRAAEEPHRSPGGGWGGESTGAHAAPCWSHPEPQQQQQQHSLREQHPERDPQRPGQRDQGERRAAGSWEQDGGRRKRRRSSRKKGWTKRKRRGADDGGQVRTERREHDRDGRLRKRRRWTRESQREWVQSNASEKEKWVQHLVVSSHFSSRHFVFSFFPYWAYGENDHWQRYLRQWQWLWM